MQPTHTIGGYHYPMKYDQIQLISKLENGPRWYARKLLAINSVSPRFLYKYFNLNHLNSDSIRNVKSVMLGSQLWLSRPSSFNDPFDLRADFQFSSDPVLRRKYIQQSAKGARKKIAGRKDNIDRIVRNASRKIINNPNYANDTFLEIRDENGVCCFTEDPKSILMWAHYADSHKGICLQFEVSRSIEVLMFAQLVEYSEEFPIIEWPKDKDRLIQDVIFRKYYVWRYESERRIVMGRSPGDRPLAFNQRALTGVICGHRMQDETMHLLLEFLEERRKIGFSEVKIYRCEPMSKKYGMRIVSK